MIAKEECPDIERHISTQANSTNYATYNFWYAQGASRVVAARELSLKELSEIRANIPENRAKEWYTSDFSLSKNFSWRKTAIRLTAEINNIFNQQYEVVQCYPMPGTNVKFIVNVTI